MKRILFAVLIILFAASPSFGAIHANTVWEIRYDATGGNVNGCGFNPSNATPGTDYSQQAAAEDSGTDLASADGDASPCVITSASHDFVDADEGNLIHITETGTGFTVGWYEIVSTSGNAATLDRACGSDGAKTGGDWYLGGACSLNSALDTGLAAATVAGNTVFIKYNANTILFTTQNLIFTNGTTTAQTKIIGYDTTRTATNTNANRPTLDGATRTFRIGTCNILSNIIFTGTVDRLVNMQDGGAIVTRCKITNTSGSANQSAVYGTGLIFNNEISSTNGYAVLTSASSRVIGNFIHDSSIGIKGDSSTTYNIIYNNIIKDITTTGIDAAAGYGWAIIHNTIFGAEEAEAEGNSTGIAQTTGYSHFIANNIIKNFGDAATSTNLYPTIYMDYNAIHGNSDQTPDNITLLGNNITTDPAFSSSATDDMRVGTNMKALGFPNGVALPGTNASALGYMDIGALQRVEPTASGGGGAWGF